MEEHIRDNYRKAMAKRGDCPASEDLIRYHQRELSTEEMLRIKQHVNACGSCDLVLVEISQFDSDDIQRVSEGGKKSWFNQFLFHPAFAYGLVLLLLYPAYLGLRHFRQPSEPQFETAGSAMDFDLGQGSVTRSAIDEPEVIISPPAQDPFFILTFFVPVRGDRNYEMEVRNKEGHLIETETIRSRDSIGNFSVVFSTNAFPQNDYFLTVKEIDPANGSVQEQYHFPFRILYTN